MDEGAEVVTPGLLDFCLYCVYNQMMDCKLYGSKRLLYPFAKFAFDFLCNKEAGDECGAHGRRLPPDDAL